MGIALLVVLVCLTGILLNHTESLKLDSKNISNSLVLALYGIEQPQITSFRSNNHWFAQLGSYLYFNENSIANCEGALIGVIGLDTQGVYAIACESEILLITESGELVEKIGTLYQLPVPLLSIGFCDGKPCLQNSASFYSLNINELSWEPISTNESLLSSNAVPPREFVRHWQKDYIGDAISVERLLLDLHSGRILSGLGVFVMDICAVLLCVLVISGVWLWLKTISAKR